MKNNIFSPLSFVQYWLARWLLSQSIRSAKVWSLVDVGRICIKMPICPELVSTINAAAVTFDGVGGNKFTLPNMMDAKNTAMKFISILYVTKW